LLLAEVRKLVARLQEQSLTDELTGVANRRAFLEVATREIERSRRYRHELSLAYLDLDDFKAVNDRRGHVAGDRVLIALAGLARAAVPLAERLCAACSRAAGSDAAPVTCSVGVVTFEGAPTDVEDLLANADALMYEAKAAGGDSVRHARVGAAEATAADGRLLPFAPRPGA